MKRLLFARLVLRQELAAGCLGLALAGSWGGRCSPHMLVGRLLGYLVLCPVGARGRDVTCIHALGRNLPGVLLSVLMWYARAPNGRMRG